MFNKLFSGQGAAFKMAVLAAVPFLIMWAYFKSTPVRPAAVPMPAAVAVDTATWYNPLSWGRDVAANEAAAQTLSRTAAYVEQAREADAAGINSILLSVALVAAVGAVLAKVLEVKIPHPQISTAADAAADRALGKYREMLPPPKSATTTEGLPSRPVTARA